MPLSPVTPDLRPAVLALAPLPEQEDWSGRADETLPAAEADPHRSPVAVLDEQGSPVGFFVLDDSRNAWDALLLRAFFVDRGHQRRGHARRALQELPAYVREHLPGTRALVLTVNVRNATARAAYLDAGWRDDGELHLGGPLGPQHVLRLDLP